MKIYAPLLALLSTVLAGTIENVDTINGADPHLVLAGTKKVHNTFAICCAESRECLIL